MVPACISASDTKRAAVFCIPIAAVLFYFFLSIKRNRILTRILQCVAYIASCRFVHFRFVGSRKLRFI